MKTYLNLLEHILKNGEKKQDRTGTGTLSVFGCQCRYRLDRFPLVTTKKVHLKSVIHELLWFLKGDTNIQYLRDNKVRIWDEWADEHGNLGPVYGAQWRSWKTPEDQALDQITHVIEQIKKNPDSRRHLVVAFNPGEIHKMALPPCHAFFQFYVSGNKLSCQLYQRSADVFLGVPFNIASYALLSMMVAQVCHLQAFELIHSLGDAHLYLNHLDQARLQLSRTPRPFPKMNLNPEVKNIFNFQFRDFTLTEYDPHPHIPAPVSV